MLRAAPFTAASLLRGDFDEAVGGGKFSREKAAFPVDSLRADKYFPPVRRKKPPKKQDAAKMPSTAALLPWTAKNVLKQVGVPPRELSRDYPEATVAQQDAKWWYLSSLDSAVVSNAEGTGASFHQREPKRVRDQMASSARLHSALATRWPQLAQEYRGALGEITSLAAWEQTFRENGVD